MQSATSRLKVMVRDTGIGIAECDLKKIFQMYSRLDCKQTVQVCGLGLSISSALVEKLGGGNITVTSIVGKGSTFSFEIDVSEDRVAAAEQEPEEEEPSILDEDIPLSLFVPRSVSSIHDFNTPHRYPEILIVDDVPFNRVVARKMLESGGYLCDEASTGLQALKLVTRRQTQGRPFRLVLMDVDMPEMDGISATRAILSLDEPFLPTIIGCSAYCSEGDKAAALDAGMRTYLFKPISRMELLEVVRGVM